MEIEKHEKIFERRTKSDERSEGVQRRDARLGAVD